MGLRHDYDGDRLIWNWELNPDQYPGWGDMVARWADEGIRVLTYVSPFFSDPSNFTKPELLEHNFYQEGLANGYFVKKRNEAGEEVPYKLHSLSIEFCMLDPTNPQGKRMVPMLM